ncbi:MAG TPA: cytochrome c-type biogenesis protein [Gemmatimonadaceae bacterium]|nr:cytochrome c-type biogenesis protein [Gemmatimonadaceae bacterium]
MMRRVMVRAVFAAAMAVPCTAHAQSQSSATSDANIDARAAAISATLRCPVCQGESIQDSPSELAGQMRAVVREQLVAGRTPDEVKAYFVGRYGEWILLEPSMTGMNVLLWAFPVLLVIGGLWLIAVVVRKWSAQTPTPDS